MNHRPNIFRFAKKELTQDAMVGWFLQCLRCDDPEYRQIGLDFLRLIFEDETLTEADITLHPDSPLLQFHHMDVYAEVRLRDKLYPIIFENKTNTYLHSDQLQNYCKTVAKWMLKNAKMKKLSQKMACPNLSLGTIHYVYIKTGYPSGWQKVQLEEEKQKARKQVSEMVEGEQIVLSFRQLYLEDLVGFVQKHRQKDALLEDYCTAMEENLQKMRFAEAHLLESVQGCTMAMGNENGNNEVGCCLLFENCFGQGVEFSYNHQNWASCDLVITHNDRKEAKIYYGFKIEQRSVVRNKEYAYAFRFYQYWDTKNASKVGTSFVTLREEEAQAARTLTKQIIQTMPFKVEVNQDEKDVQNLPSDATLFTVFIRSDNTPKAVCDFVRAFAVEFCNRTNEICADAQVRTSVSDGLMRCPI